MRKRKFQIVGKCAGTANSVQLLLPGPPGPRHFQLQAWRQIDLFELTKKGAIGIEDPQMIEDALKALPPQVAARLSAIAIRSRSDFN